jgi:hypothetical protein
VRTSFEASRATLDPATRRLRGHRMSYTAIDESSSTLAYVSFWDDLEAAKQLGSLREMQGGRRADDQARRQFERPIVNYETLWSIKS